MKNDNLKYLLDDEGVTVRVMKPYNQLVIDFLDDLSGILRRSINLAEYPDIMSLAFWCRKGNIVKLKEKAGDIDSRIGKGLVFHITPSNVPVNFAFSFIFGLISGNSNIVRVPSKDYPQTMIICDAIDKVLEDEKYESIKKGNAFVSYGHEQEVTDKFSIMADARIVWGGDASIEAIRRSPLKVKATEIVFADRYSFGIISERAIIEASEDELKNLAHNFYNDTYLMDQNACSSPHLIVWLKDGTIGGDVAKKRFWDAVYEEAIKYDLEAIKVVDKFTDYCTVAMRGDVKLANTSKWDNLLYVLGIEELPEDITVLRGRFGMFYETELNSLEEIAPYINSKVQTAMYYGVNRETIMSLVMDNGLTGIDRIVPFGKALDIGVFWDGYDIVGCLSRRLSFE